MPEPTIDTTKPPVNLTGADHAVDPPVVEDKTTAAARLREFEDKHLGKRAVRINGRVERGSGSPFQAMTDEKRAEYAALEKLVEAEQKLVEANAALSAAQVAHAEAETNLEQAAKVADEKAAEVEAAEAEEKADADAAVAAH